MNYQYEGLELYHYRKTPIFFKLIQTTNISILIGLILKSLGMANM